MLPALAGEGLVDAVDAFCEHLAFSPAQVERVFIAARELGLPVKLHAEQLSSLHGSSLAARYRALSADHLEYMTEDDARAMGYTEIVMDTLAFSQPVLDTYQRMGFRDVPPYYENPQKGLKFLGLRLDS